MAVKSHPLYERWRCMIRRCTDTNNISYPNYGARGITVCERWTTFDNFIEDMGLPPDGFTLDRIDNDGNYEPDNCRWVSVAENNRNRPHARLPLSDNPMRNIAVRPSSFKVYKQLPHRYYSKCYPTLQEAQNARDELEYECEFHYRLGLYN